MEFKGLISNHGSAKAVTGGEVCITPASRKYQNVLINLEKDQIVYLDCYYISPMAKRPLETGYYQLQEGKLVKIEYQEQTAPKYPHEIYEELADPKNYQG